MVRTSLEAGHTPDQVARVLIEEHHLLPISAIKAMGSGGNMSSVEAMEVVKRNLPAGQWAAAEKLWEMIAPDETTGDGDV